MSAATTGPLALAAPAPALPTAGAVAVFGALSSAADPAAVRLAAAVDPAFLAAVGWDARTWVLAPPPSYRLIRADGARLDVTAAHPPTRTPVAPVAETGNCAVAACLRAAGVASYCPVHAARWLTAQQVEPAGNEQRWREVAAPLPVVGQVNLRGLAPLIVAEILYGLQQRAAAQVTSYCPFLRALAQQARAARASSLTQLARPRAVVHRSLLNSLMAHVNRAFADPGTEVAKDRWDLTVLGHHGWLAFTGLSQPWLRELAKHWAVHDLPRRRGKQAGARLHEIVGALARLSATLRASRADHGEDPRALGRADVETFLHRLAFLTADGQLSAYSRVKTCQDVGRVLSQARALGLTRSGAPAAGLAEDFVLVAGDVPAKAAPGEPGRDVPAEVMRQMCAALASLEEVVSNRESRVAVQLLMDTGRRPAEVCSLAFDCLHRAADATAVLVYDNAKAHRLGRRLPISEHTATLIAEQQAAVRARFPDTPLDRLVLLPSRRLNPLGTRAITEDNLIGRHRVWLTAMGVLRRADGCEHDKKLITLYSYRHSYAQRHADAGVGIDVLCELMDHACMDTTKRYYRVGEDRRRGAVERVAAMQFDRHGQRVWREAGALLEAEHARYALGTVAVPYGSCTEPSNVAAGGGACPIRFRCAGCDHFRTDVSYLPDLVGYLDDLLRARERLAAAVQGVDEWARREATPSGEEITRVRHLIGRIKADLAELPAVQRSGIDEAVGVLRRHRATFLGMPGQRTGVPADP